MSAFDNKFICGRCGLDWVQGSIKKKRPCPFCGARPNFSFESIKQWLKKKDEIEELPY